MCGVRGWTRSRGPGGEQHVQACCPLPYSCRDGVTGQEKLTCETCLNGFSPCASPTLGPSSGSHTESICSGSKSTALVPAAVDGSEDAPPLRSHTQPRSDTTTCRSPDATKRAQRPPPGAPRAAGLVAATANKDGRRAARARRRPSFERVPSHARLDAIDAWRRRRPHRTRNSRAV